MKKHILIITLCIVAASCNNNNVSTNTVDDNNVIDEHTSQNSLDWEGDYEGTTPCADCPGIKTNITLKQDNTFYYTAEYLERNTIIKDSGSIMWHDNGSVIHLKTTNLDVKYIMGENILIQLDADGNKIEGDIAEYFNLKKVQ